jgi:hypothetical protein
LVYFLVVNIHNKVSDKTSHNQTKKLNLRIAARNIGN